MKRIRHLPRRRDILRSTVALSLGAAASPLAFANRSLGRADLIISGGTFHTMDDASAAAEAMAIRGNRILAVGGMEDIRALAGPNTRTIHARGLTITPGFIDAHSHPLLVNNAISVDVNVRSIAEVKTLLRQQASGTPAGQWVLAHMYDDTKFDEGRPLTRDDIDAVVTDLPVMVRHRGGHTAVVNSQAFDMAGIANTTPDPEGGRYFREDGRLTGKVAEHAMEVFDSVGIWPSVDRDTRRRGASLMLRQMAASGLTSTTDAGGDMEGWIAYMDALDAGDLATRVSFMPRGEDPVYAAMKTTGMRSGFGNAMLRIGAVKYGADGSASERTMRMSTPFEGTDDYGILTMSQEDIDAAVDDAVKSGFRIGIHANGDVTIDMVLRAYERVLTDWEGDNPRFRIEHCSLVNDDLLQRIKATGTIPTPFYTYAHYHGNKWVDYGPEKMRSMFAHRSFLDYGIPVAPASDFTPGPYEPMMALQSMVTRKDMQGRTWGENQRISVREALRISTLNGAYASFEEHEKGSLTPGKLADFVMLEQDPDAADPDSIKDIKVIATYMDGRATFEA